MWLDDVVEFVGFDCWVGLSTDLGFVVSLIDVGCYCAMIQAVQPVFDV